ncbi:MAG: substrate-binding domain-containing protein [Rhodobacteraceae bacterium]|nr:substrate-binding domain-containing protein [Paracoccaceae bacterium]
MSFVKVAASTLVLSSFASGLAARDNVQIAGSSTVLPYASIVAEYFGENFDFPTPAVESGGSSAGLARFCEGIGENMIDIANASRAIKATEIAVCAANGVTEIIEVRIGYDGIVFASDLNGPSFAFTPSHWFNALSPQVMVGGALVDNPYTNWSQIDPDLPDQEIAAFIPGTKHGTREVFEDKVLTNGCEATGALDALIAELGEDAGEDACIAVRTDGVSIDIDGDYTETLARVDANPNGIGVFGLAFYENNTDRLQTATMSGIEPNVETISTGTYPVSRPLFFYIKAAHIGVIPGLKEYAEFFISDDMAGEDGPLAEYGLVSDPALEETQMIVADEIIMTDM